MFSQGRHAMAPYLGNTHRIHDINESPAGVRPFPFHADKKRNQYNVEMSYMDYHRRSIRLRGHNYAQGGQYFITICTKNREPLFGKIRNGMMGLSNAGCIVADEWQKTSIIRPYVTLDSWVIMPDHFHGILHIDDVGADIIDRKRASCHDAPTGLMAHSLGSIIGQFKIVTTKRIRSIDRGFAWQRNYHEHIIRSENELQCIRQYIMNNPKNWGKMA